MLVLELPIKFIGDVGYASLSKYIQIAYLNRKEFWNIAIALLDIILIFDAYEYC